MGNNYGNPLTKQYTPANISKEKVQEIFEEKWFRGMTEVHMFLQWNYDTEEAIFKRLHVPGLDKNILYIM